MNKLSPCPFCGGELCSGTNIRKKPVMRHPYNSNCPLSEASWVDTPGFRERWNRRSAWISVEDRLPESEGYYIIYDGRNVATCGYNGHGGWWTDYIVTHWMPLPQVPERPHALTGMVEK